MVIYGDDDDDDDDGDVMYGHMYGKFSVCHHFHLQTCGISSCHPTNAPWQYVSSSSLERHAAHQLLDHVPCFDI